MAEIDGFSYPFIVQGRATAWKLSFLSFYHIAVEFCFFHGCERWYKATKIHASL